MKSISEIAQELESKRVSDSKESQVSRSQEFEKNYLYEVLAGIADYLVENQSKDDKKRIVDFPLIQKVAGTVQENNSSNILKVGTLLLNAVKKIKFPEIQKITGRVEIANQVKIPEIKIPEYPKQIKSDITSLPKYISDKLDALKKSVDSLEMKPEVKVNVDTKEPVVRIDLSGVISSLQAVLEAVKGQEIAPVVEIDSAGIIRSNNSVQKAIESIKFPVPNFKSSWSHSMDMQSKDLETNYAYKTVATKKVIDYIEVIGTDGGVYRRTYTYDTDGTTDVLNKSKWIRQ